MSEFATREFTGMQLAELKKLEDLEWLFKAEYERVDLTGAQRLNTLSERRKIVELRARIEGLIEEREGDGYGS